MSHQTLRVYQPADSAIKTPAVTLNGRFFYLILLYYLIHCAPADVSLRTKGCRIRLRSVCKTGTLLPDPDNTGVGMVSQCNQFSCPNTGSFSNQTRDPQ